MPILPSDPVKNIRRAAEKCHFMKEASFTAE
jgi:hypothetical protein